MSYKQHTHTYTQNRTPTHEKHAHTYTQTRKEIQRERGEEGRVVKARNGTRNTCVEHGGTYLKDGNSGPEDIVEMFTVAFTLRMLGDNFWTSTFPFFPAFFDKLTELTSKKVHAKNAINCGTYVCIYIKLCFQKQTKKIDAKTNMYMYIYN